MQKTPKCIASRLWDLADDIAEVKTIACCTARPASIVQHGAWFQEGIALINIAVICLRHAMADLCFLIMVGNHFALTEARGAKVLLVQARLEASKVGACVRG